MMIGVNAGEDFAGARLGDERRSKRAARIVETLSRDPSVSFPRAFVDRASLEAFYRFVENDDVSYEALVEAHAEATVVRARDYSRIVMIHDTSEVVLGDRVEGIGRLKGKDRGFLAHVALAVGFDRRPLGVGGFIPVVRDGKPRGQLTSHALAKIPADEKESRRWADLIEMTEGRFAGQSLLHVCDREADTYPLLSHLVERDVAFIVRVSKDRKIEDATGDLSLLRESMSRAATVVERHIHISGRPARYHTSGLLRVAARTERVARLGISARSLELKQPQMWRGKTLPSLPVNVVWVRELEPPAGEAPVDWLLVTTEEIATVAQIEAVVDAYRMRWLIEEFFKALKTGCQYEKRQLESLDAFLVTFALLAPIACQLLDLRSLTRANPKRPAVEVMGTVRVHLLRTLQKSYKMPKEPTVRDALLAVAALGGHLKNNGEPGWLVLGRGMEDLLNAEAGWLAAIEHARKM